MPDSSPHSRPPSEPRPFASRPGADAEPDRGRRFEIIAVVGLLLVLVTIPLYLWRRPRAVADDVDAAPSDSAPLPSAVSSAPEPDAGSAVQLSEARITECHDPGPKHTPASECDHLTVFEQTFAQAIRDNASCVPTGTGGGKIIYDADVSYARKKTPVTVTLPNLGRTVKSTKAVTACSNALKHALATVTLDEKHSHARYKIEITATYP